MTTFACLVFCTFGVIDLAHLCVVCSFIKYLFAKPPDAARGQYPPAAVVLCLRGVDPFLDDCLTRIGRLDYPDFRVHVILDSEGDPAHAVVERWRASDPGIPITIESLRDVHQTCTLYCSALHQAIRSLDDRVEVVAFANADTMVHPAWLRSLVAPLLDEEVGAVTGSRWYVPAQRRPGSLVRFARNATAVVANWALGLTWGGSLALKRSVFRHPRFLWELEHAPCEDQAIQRVLRTAGLRLVSTPAVLMLNQEECSLAFALRFVRRQTFWSRINRGGWASIVAHAVATLGLFVAALGLAVTAVRTGDMRTLAWALGAIGLHWAANALVLLLLHPAVMVRLRRDQPDCVARFHWRDLAGSLWILPLTFIVHELAVWQVWWNDRIEWRGIQYTRGTAGNLRLDAYRPYLLTASESRHSL